MHLDLTRISELARITGNTPETIRYYERIGLLPPAVRELRNNYRQYGEAHEARLDFIRRCRSLDIGLEEIRTLLSALDSPNPESAACAHALVDKHLKEVNCRIRELKALRGHLQELKAHCCGEHKEGEMCGIIAELTIRRDDPANAAQNEIKPEERCDCGCDCDCGCTGCAEDKDGSPSQLEALAPSAKTSEARTND